ncbi:MAG: S8 family serine peptidase [Hyphomonadaceae bacterium]
MDALRTGRIAGHALAAALLSACAGGGGGGGSGSIVAPPPPPPAAPPPPAVTFPPLAPPHAPGDFPDPASSEYRNNWGVAGTNAIVAWQNGATGQGVLVGVVDDGIHPNASELRGRISPLSVDIVAGRDALVTDQSHGSELSSLIAGNYNGARTVGVAFDATILAVRADNGSSGFSNADLARGIDYAVANGVDVINLSLGSPQLSPTVRDAIARGTAAGVIFVVSAGNSGDTATDVNYPGRFANDPAIGRGLILVAGGLNADGSLNQRSNPPGTTANYYLTAPGWEIIVPDYGPDGPVPGFQTCGPSGGLSAGLCRIQGTSYASPHVAGAIALVMSGFPGLTPQQVVDLLLTTTDDTGAPGVDSLHGRGRLNIGRAFAPVGALSTPLMAGVDVGAETQLGVAGAAFGDGLTNSADEWRVAAFDQYGRAFALDLGGAWGRAHPGPGAAASAPFLWRSARSESGALIGFAAAESAAPASYRMQIAREDVERAPMRIDAPLGPRLELSFAAFGADAQERQARSGAIGHFAFVQADTSVRLTGRIAPFASVSFLSESGEADVGLAQAPVDRSVQAVQAHFALGPVTLGLSEGRVREQQGVLGLGWSEALGPTPGGETRFTGVSLETPLAARWRFAANAEFGVARAADAGWLSVDTPLRTTAFSAEAVRPLGAGALSLSLAQPLRIEGGTLGVMLPTATAYGLQSVAYERRSIDPAPSGRELKFGVSYRVLKGDVFSAFGEAIYVHEPGHVAGAEPDTIFRFGLRIAH